MLAEHDLRVEAGVEPGTGPDPAVRGVQVDPVARGDTAGYGRGRMHLDLRVRRALAQGGDLAVLGLAEEQRFCTTEHQRVPIGEVPTGARAGEWFLKGRQW